MAARLRKLHQEDVREKIRTSQLINRLENHALGEADVKLEATQVRAIEVLLKKVLPDLQSTELSGDPDNPVGVTQRIERVVIDPANPDAA